MKLKSVLYALPTLLTALSLMSQTSSQPAKIEHLDKALDQLIEPGAKLEKLATGYTWTEGPVWMEKGGYLLFADIPANSILKFTPGQGASLFMKPSGWNQPTPFGGKEPGSNGMTLDAQGRLTVAGHANRNVWRMETHDAKGQITILADSYEGKRLNSPNDLVYRSDGSLFFTDPPYGLATQQDNDPKKELKVNGVYCLPGAAHLPAGSPPANKALRLIISDITRPNGLAFSPDEKHLYVGSSDLKKKIWMRYDVAADGSVANGKLIADVTTDPRHGSPDGMKVDRKGNLFSTGPGGIWIFSPEGKHLGTIEMPEPTANLAWGGADGRTLYITASTSLYKMSVKTGGTLPK